MVSLLRGLGEAVAAAAAAAAAAERIAMQAWFWLYPKDVDCGHSTTSTTLLRRDTEYDRLELVANSDPIGIAARCDAGCGLRATRERLTGGSQRSLEK
ncbi:hypothetical protein F4820DRAFT_451560 [Hypoxylon rubiginosum]|uniref:Uncharacterized protein n=1 Tax=Hypoxylon rubiginosum TaxID=110542 RepID=A0ACB9YSB9_9PEZI|nr:hypothetical protein F4820DRAFT_451560 [Hypoxylon rubiginosum]